MQYIKSNWALALFIGVFSVIFLGFEWNRLADFSIMQVAGINLSEGKDIYIENELGFKYYYSPLFALLLSGAPSSEFIWFGWIWKLINILFLFRIWNIISTNYLVINEKNERNKFIILSFLCAFYLLFDTFHFVQMSVFIIYATIEGLHQIQQKNRPLFGSIIIALAINIKILPIVILPYLVFRKEIAAFAMIIVFSGLLLFLPGLIIGWDYNYDLLHAWWNNINPISKSHILDLGEPGLHNIGSLISSLFSDQFLNEHDLHIRRHITVLSYSSLNYLINFARLILILSVLIVFRWTPWSKEKTPKKLFYEWAVLLLVAVLIFPHQQIYGFALAFPAITLLVHYFMTNGKSKSVSFLLFVIAVVITSLGLLFGFARDYFSHFKTMTYGILMIWGLLLWVSAKQFGGLKTIKSQ